MKSSLSALLQQAIANLHSSGTLPADISPDIQLERTRDPAHGDLATNLALTLAKPMKMNPKQIAQLIIDALPQSDVIEKTDIAGPGFINFFLTDATNYSVIQQVLKQGAAFGHSQVGQGKKVQLEFVSANPTGPLHVGHGRGAAYGASYANLLTAAGFAVDTEYYVNDAGRQMDILATSVWLRYLQACGQQLTFPSNAYQGDYIKAYAETLKQQHQLTFQQSTEAVFCDITPDEADGGDKEKHIDDLIARAQRLLGHDAYQQVFAVALDGILGDIKTDLAEFGVEYQQWFSERSLTTPSNLVERAIQKLDDAGYIEQRDGALWFLSTQFGDDKDRVVKRDNGQTTYFASDIAYHLNKFERGFDQVINIWGADHHGYIARVKAALTALGLDAEKLTIRLVQFVSLYRGEQQLQMSTRSGSFVTLRDLREDVGSDATRFFYVTRKAEQPMDFDLELAKSTSKDNPVYYIQYAHARICSVFNKAAEQQLLWDQTQGIANLTQLNQQVELDLCSQLASYPEVIEKAALEGEPHQLANFLKELAGNFHAWYNNHKTLVEEAELRQARLTLCKAIQQVLSNGLQLLGVSAPEKM